MPIIFRCKTCRQKLSVSRGKAGSTVRCPQCGNAAAVPELRDQAPVEPEQQPDIKPILSWHDPHPAIVKDDEESFAPRKPIEFEEMDLTPMVDVTFLLLIFFMVTASFSLQKTMDIPAPDPNEQGTAVSDIEQVFDQSIRVEIDAENVITVEGEVVADRSLLSDKIREKTTSDQKNELILVPDARAFHETTVAVVDAAHAAGVQKIRLTSGPGGNAN